MAKRRQKKRTHAQLTPEQEQGIPKSMVIRVGQTSLANHSLNQLVKDFRQIMQPHTAIKLKERKSNKLKDFVVMCGPLGVTHLFMFTQSEKTGNVSLKIARTPQGPTVTFQVLDYSLGRDIKNFLKRPKSLNNDDVLNPPLLVLNGFSTSKRSGEDDQDVNVEKVIVSMFQNIFPPLNPARTSLNSIKRVFMINKDRETGEISMRHYFIDIREVEISRNLKRLYKAKNNLSKTVPNLHRKEDISSLILDHDLGAYTSESEIEDDAIVRVVDNQDVKAKHSQSLKSQRTSVEKKDNKEREKETEEEDVEMEEPKPSENLQPTPRKKAIKLTELGPRLTLKLVKIEEGICSGKVLHHEFVQKSSEEIKALEKRHAAKMRLKEQRKKEQEENIAKKKAVKDAKKQRKLERRKARAAEGGEGQGKDDAMSDDESSSSDSEHYGSVPEDLDSDLFSEVE
ncbi:ADM_collapsed_G0024660.mRNA.1.CDS.1 [Saccharomyces cerevisiae]|nr:ADM_HP2_G0021950.mRNA.1.CDS.1 [Saccharomyces cerevisiae]CAI6463357.1 ADM_HP2_G0021950.mRNA.1.CDS.1 [Saccharomyces cerevisiae]CAI6475167.1 ADM_HP1_G0024580.mRNA.1.CDS.1 [Saccharomyces cerevisiae]CAI6715063.1 ADM_collapsed_G0024660.mRNA.1.CDS.1 [Saccharomyces cerevisiae]